MQQISFNLSIEEAYKAIKPRTMKDVKDEIYEHLLKCHKQDTDLELKTAFVQKRKAKLYPKPSYVGMLGRLAGCKTIADLEWLLGYCKEAKHFSKTFYWRTNPNSDLTNKKFG